MAAFSCAGASHSRSTHPRLPSSLTPKGSRRPLRVTAAATGVLTPTPPEQRGEQGPAADGASQRWPLPLPIPGWFRRAESEQEEAPRAPVQVQVAAGSKQPILSFAGGGIFFW